MNTLEISDLTIEHGGERIIQNINLSVGEGEWVAVVGESGSGKSVTASSIGGLLPKQLSISSGSIRFQHVNLDELSEKHLRKFRGKEISYIFQDYQGAFSPFMTIGAQMDEMLKTHTNHPKTMRKDMAMHSLDLVCLPGERSYTSYPCQLSGGQLQRAAIAMAVILQPKLLIADEPTTALDSMTASTILKLLDDIKQKTNCGILFITHDLRHVKRFADTVSIMQDGQIVETGETYRIFEKPQHSYTQALFSAIPALKETPKRLLTV